MAQSRRTRDLWASSFLLSHLAATAIDEVQRLGGRVVLPAWDEETRAKLLRHDFGTVPNRFVADFDDGAAAKAAAESARLSLLNQWRRVADSVWQEHLTHIESAGDRTRNIWDRQIASFWDIVWVMGSVEQSDQLLVARKNWRTPPTAIEPGDHCTMMSDRQELSGWVRSRSREAREKQDEFWRLLRSRLGRLDLGEDERLCAIALIKRLYPRVVREFIDRELDQKSWPSTAYVAAIPWLLKVAENSEARSGAIAYAEQVRGIAANSLGERATRIPALQRLKEHTGDFLSLDGNFFQKNAIDNEKVTPFEKALDESEDARQRRQLKSALDKLSQAVGANPSAFYAVLLMDGDSMGALLAQARKLADDGEQRVTRALSEFSVAVTAKVGEQDGVTIYAGGDDVLAMLPLPTALACAMELADAYRTAFRAACQPGSQAAAIESLVASATLSGAIVYAHYHTPLRHILRTAHHLLDDVAKDATGRDSLAVAVFKSSGVTAQWSAPWQHIRQSAAVSRANNIIDELIFDLGGAKDEGSRAGGRHAEFSSSFLYNVRERFAALTNKPLTTPGQFGRLTEDLSRPGNNLLRKVLEADYLRCMRHREGETSAESKKAHAAAAIERLLKLCQQATRRRVSQDPPRYEVECDSSTLGIDGALLARFLASDGKEGSP